MLGEVYDLAIIGGGINGAAIWLARSAPPIRSCRRITPHGW
jgi:hypothetical protein